MDGIVNARRRRGLIMIVLIFIPFLIGLLFTFGFIQIPFPTNMAIQPFIDYQEGPRILPPDEAVPVQGLSIISEEFPINPGPADEVSIQRGAILYDIHCKSCHGALGHGDGSLSHYFDRTPNNLTSAQITGEFDGSVYLTIVQGFGQMPSLAENLTNRERWDVINYVRTLPPQ